MPYIYGNDPGVYVTRADQDQAEAEHIADAICAGADEISSVADAIFGDTVAGDFRPTVSAARLELILQDMAALAERLKRLRGGHADA